MKLKNQNKYQIMKLLRGIEKGIKLKCFDCVGHQKGFDCENSECSLYQFRPWSKKNTASHKNIKNLNKDKYGEIYQKNT